MQPQTDKLEYSFPLKAIVYSLFLLGCCFALYLFGSIYWDTYKDMSYFKGRQDTIGQQLSTAQNQLQSAQAYLNKIEQDTRFRTQVARQRLGHSRPEEMLFRFQSPKTLANE